MEKSVVIVDDHLLFAKSLKILVDSFEGYTVTGTFRDGKDLVDYLSLVEADPDVVLLDIKMPVMNGLETMQWIRENQPDLRVLALSMEDDEATVLSMIKQGVDGYVLKDIDPEELYRALQDLMTKGFYHSELIGNAINQEKEGHLEALTDTEALFLKLVCSELTYREIALKMDRSFRTIDGYRESLFKKLKVKSRTGLAMYAVKHNLITV